jgi:hypothetical protein
MMAWPFGGSANKDRDEDAALTEDRLKIMANIAIEQVPLPVDHLPWSYKSTTQQHRQCAERGSKPRSSTCRTGEHDR